MTSQCIYPGPHGKISEEHYLPEGLGTFQGDTLLLNRVCNNCNTEIGNRTETQFLRAGPIAFFRWLLGIEGKDGPPPSPFYRGAAGAPAIYSIGRAPGFDYDLLWEIHRGTEEVYPLRQIVFYHPIAGFHPVPVLDSMRGRVDLLLKHLQ